MIAAVSALAASAGESSLGQFSSKVSDVIDCAIPIVITVMLAIGWGSVIFGFVD